MRITEDRLSDAWTAAERSEYAALMSRPTAGVTGSAVPALVRECLLAMHAESADDDLTRALAAVGVDGDVGGP